jgi:hypothetical protein
VYVCCYSDGQLRRGYELFRGAQLENQITHLTHTYEVLGYIMFDFCRVFICMIEFDSWTFACR